MSIVQNQYWVALKVSQSLNFVYDFPKKMWCWLMAGSKMNPLALRFHALKKWVLLAWQYNTVSLD